MKIDVKAKAYAKLNISLDVLARRADGYHELRSVMQSVGLCDTIRITSAENGLCVKTNRAYLPSDEKNMAAKAAAAFLRHTGIECEGLMIEIDKKIPVCAGLGGGSSDAAAVLRALNKAYAAGLSAGQLQTIAATLGSDVPFCVVGGTSLAQGRGEELTPLPDIPVFYVVICKPVFSVSTPELFSRVRCEKIRLRPDMDGLIDAIARKDQKGIARRVFNVLEDALPKGGDEIREIKGTLIDCGAMGASMSGSGSSVFGLFDSEENAVYAFRVLKSRFTDTFLTKTTPRIEIGEALNEDWPKA